MEQDTEPKNKAIHLWSINIQQRSQEYTTDKRVSSASGTKKAGQSYVK